MAGAAGFAIPTVEGEESCAPSTAHGLTGSPESTRLTTLPLPRSSDGLTGSPAMAGDEAIQDEKTSSSSNSSADSSDLDYDLQNGNDSESTVTQCSEASSDEESEGDSTKSGLVRPRAKGNMATIVSDAEMLMMPVRPLCGLCPRISCFEELPCHPRKICISEGQKRAAKVWLQELDDIRLPSPPPQSRFSSEPHERFPTMSSSEYHKIDCWSRQRAKQHIVQNAAKAIGKQAKKLLREQEEDLTVSTLRALCRKSHDERSALDLDFICKYLCDKFKSFFTDMSHQLLEDVTRSLKADRFHSGETMWELGDPAQDVYFLISGRVSIVQGVTSDTGACKRGRIVSAPACIGAEDILKDGFNEHFQFIEAPALLRKRSVLVEKTVDVLVLDQQTLEMLAAQQKIREDDYKRELLFKFLGQSKSVSALLTKTDLFDLEEFLRPKVLFPEQLAPSLEEARISIVVSGEVQLRKKGRFMGMLGPGGIVGDDVLYGIPYRHSVYCDSSKVKCLTILAKDYLEHVLKRTTIIDEAPKDIENHTQSSQICPRSMIKAVQAEIQAKNEVRDLQAHEWKKLQPKIHPSRTMPVSPCKPFVTPSASGVVSHVEVGFPTESDLFPSAYRTLIKQTPKVAFQRHIAAEPEPIAVLGLRRMKPAGAGKFDPTASKASLATVATTATWSSTGQQTMSSRHSRKDSSTGSVHLTQKGVAWPQRQRLEEIHNFHVARGGMEEDLDGSPLPDSIPAAGRSVLMVCRQAPKGSHIDHKRNVAECVAKYSVWGASRSRGS